MINKDEGIIVFTKKIKDNDLFIKVVSSEDKIVSGIVYGGNSSKKKSINRIRILSSTNLSNKIWGYRGLKKVRSRSTFFLPCFYPFSRKK